MDGPLSGLQVVECASFVAGPTGGMTLAQLGADVVRVDPIGGGNDLRRWPVVGGGADPAGDSYYWTSLNKGKKSIAVDLRSAEGRELVLALVTAPGPNAGILFDNVVGRRWMAPEVLAERRSDLIHVRLQGHPDGRPAVDYTVNAEVGVPGITGPVDGGAPVNHVMPAWDIVAGMAISTAVLAAVHERRERGNGAFVQLALADVALAGVANLGWLSEAAERGSDRPRHGNQVYGSFGTDFLCGDGRRIMVVALTEGQWAALCRVTSTEKVFDALSVAFDADLADEAERYRLRDTITAVLRPWFAGRTLREVAEALDAAHVLWGPYRSMDEVVSVQRSRGYPVLAELDMPAGGSTSITARSPMRWNGSYGEPGRLPVLGRDTEQVLAERLGLGTAEISRLRARGVIASEG